MKGVKKFVEFFILVLFRDGLCLEVMLELWIKYLIWKNWYFVFLLVLLIFDLVWFGLLMVSFGVNGIRCLGEFCLFISLDFDFG